MNDYIMPSVKCLIDKYKSGYLGMARCFNVQGNLVIKTYQGLTHSNLV